MLVGPASENQSFSEENLHLRQWRQTQYILDLDGEH